MLLLVFGRVGAHLDAHQHGISIQISVNLGKSFLRISRKMKNCTDLNLVEVPCIFNSFHFPDSGLDLFRCPRIKAILVALKLLCYVTLIYTAFLKNRDN